ncbi:MAG: calcium/sodium antiporter [Lachnospiraceae bacterium]|nr:calcium/sodium antiporter [Lachnospiraceae bacterium]
MSGSLFWTVLLFGLGLLLLIKGGDWFVDGAVGIARRFHVPEIIIGATVVSIGTTLPEVMVSAGSAVSGHGEIAYGNAIGSVICNTALIAALTIAIRPADTDGRALRVPVLFFFVSAVFYAFNAYVFGAFSRWTGIVLLLIFVLYMILNVRNGLLEARTAMTEMDPQDQEEAGPLFMSVVLLVLGAFFIALGADLLVDHGTELAVLMHVPESVIALTFVALGTSLPELVTAISSLVKGHSALSLGNVIGANVFNLVLVSGMSVTLSPFKVPVEKQLFGRNASLLVDFPVMFLVMLILTLPAVTKGKLSRGQGIALLAIYAAFCIFQFAV